MITFLKLKDGAKAGPLLVVLISAVAKTPGEGPLLSKIYDYAIYSSRVGSIYLMKFLVLVLTS
jgi:hypothetical protein